MSSSEGATATGDEQLVVAVFTFRTKERLTKQRIKEEVVSPPCTKRGSGSHVVSEAYGDPRR
jgi:hypothetical protein